ncbi:hypothetical protein BST97_00080 [Nonlabens spongiae]|uniref:Glycosyltransferase 2-like domain-containing protein n=1 Tax=Nonlabens spongiae TaxID=331648 RepID=A0A1W6MG82_9FLAO|nr:glycosyltransferase [Nonlabens spongiae]ARN76526.1 hypothetical protein BST97_00080 [Nonlabens spongiae]
MEKIPLVSLCIFTYNQQDYIEEAIDGAFSQDYDNLEIIISDDNSSDKTWQLIQEKVARYDGKHKIKINRNTPNLGIAAHVNKLYYDLSKGDYIAIAAGDDISLPQRVSKSVSYMVDNKGVVALSTRLIYIDKNSQIAAHHKKHIEQDSIYDLEYFLSPDYNHINGPSRFIDRKLIDAFTPLNKNCPTEDTPMLLRCFLSGKVALLRDELVKYRIHESNVSSEKGLQKMNINFIFVQYDQDIAFAKAEKMITPQIALRLTQKIEEIKRKRLKKKEKQSILQRLKSRLP